MRLSLQPLVFYGISICIMARLSLTLSSTLLLCIVLILARIIADNAGYRLGKPAAPTVVASLSPATQDRRELSQYAAILESGLFGPATKGSLTPIQQKVAAAGPQVTTVQQADLQLIGTAIGSSKGGFALIRRTSSNEERVFRQGDRIFDLGSLTAIRKDAAVVTTATGQTITLLTPEAAPPSAGPAAATVPATSPQARPGALKGITRPSGNDSGVIEQRALDAALENIGQAMTDARLLPSVKDGNVEGFRLSEVKPQGIFGAIGLRNGDVLRMINDYPIDSPEKAIQSFMTLKGQTRIKLDLIRDGAPTTLSYDIR